jgi:hypothetical protein
MTAGGANPAWSGLYGLTDRIEALRVSWHQEPARRRTVIRADPCP